MNILVTGGSGFVGRNLLPELADAGHTVQAPSRGETGEIGPDTEWNGHLGGIDTVIHLAARVHVMKDTAPNPLAAFRKVNTEGTIRLIDAAVASGVRRFVYLSSIKVHGEGSSRSFTALDRPAPQDPYGISKLEAELAIAARSRQIETVILRPPLVYGPGVGGNFLRLIRLVDRGMPLPLASVRNRRSLINVANLSAAIRWALDAPPGTYLPSDGDDKSTPDLVKGIASALDRPARLFPVPLVLLRLTGAVAGQAGAIDRLIGSLTVDNALPGWLPPCSVEAGLKQVARWYRCATCAGKSDNYGR